MAAEDSYVYRWHCTDDNRLICQSNWSDFDEYDVWSGTSSTDCRQYGTINERPRSCKGRGRIILESGIKNTGRNFSNLMSGSENATMKSNLVYLGSAALGGYLYMTKIKVLSNSTYNTLLGVGVGLGLGYVLNKYVIK